MAAQDRARFGVRRRSRPPALVGWLAGGGAGSVALLNVAVAATVVIALLQAGSAYLNAYYTVSIGQWIAHDLRQSVYAHLQRLSMSYYDRQQIGPLISTITDDINAVQDFVSTSLLDIVIDSLTIVGMLAVMFVAQLALHAGRARRHAARAGLRLPAARR